MKTLMMEKMKNIFERVFKNSPKLQKFPLQIAKENVYLDTKLQDIFLKYYLSND